MSVLSITPLKRAAWGPKAKSGTICPVCNRVAQSTSTSRAGTSPSSKVSPPVSWSEVTITNVFFSRMANSIPSATASSKAFSRLMTKRGRLAWPPVSVPSSSTIRKNPCGLRESSSMLRRVMSASEAVSSSERIRDEYSRVTIRLKWPIR